MNIKNKFVTLAVIGLGLSSFMVAAPTYAEGDFHHHGGFPNHHNFPHHHGFPNHHGWDHHHGNAGGAIAAGLIAGAAVGMIAAAAASHDSYENCQRVFYTHDCHYDSWGYRHCYVVKHFRPC